VSTRVTDAAVGPRRRRLQLFRHRPATVGHGLFSFSRSTTISLLDRCDRMALRGGAALSLEPIFLVEDDPLVARAVTRFFEPEFDVVHAATRALALEKLFTHDAWRLALIDVKLRHEERGGLDVFRAARERFASTPAIVTSALRDPTISHEVFRTSARGSRARSASRRVPFGIRSIISCASPRSRTLGPSCGWCSRTRS
jgi:CheY-like chemotaxis protein